MATETLLSRISQSVLARTTGKKQAQVSTMKNQMNKIAAIALTALAWPSGPAFSEVQYLLRAGAAYNDNVRRQPSSDEDGTIGIAGLTLSTSYESLRTTASLDIDADHRMYSEEGTDNETVGSADANVLLRISPGFFEWFAQYEFGTVLSDPFGANQPANRGNISTISTGPNFHLDLGNITFIELQGRYIDSTYETIDLDNNTLRGDLSLVRMLSPNRSLNLTATADRTEFDTGLQETKFDRQSVYLGLDSESSHGNISIAAGYNELHDAGEVLDGTLLTLSFTRELTQRSTFVLDYDQRVSDAGDLYRRFGNSQAGIEDVIDFTDVVSPVANRRLGMTISLRGRVTSYDFSAIADDLDFESEETRNRRRVYLQATLSRPIGSGWKVDLAGRLSRNEFEVSERVDDDVTAELGVDRRLTERLGLRFQYAYATRNSEDPASEYDQNEYTLLFTYGNR
jgi:hypothetical protein